MNTIAERIKFAMKVKNKKQIEIVRDTGISKGAFSSYLSGQYNPKLDKLQLIADSLEVDVKWLSGENVPMQTATQNTDTVQQYLFYNNSCSEYLIDDTSDTYIGLMNEHSTLVPRFYVLVNPSMNEMHLLPIFLKKTVLGFITVRLNFLPLTDTAHLRKTLTVFIWYWKLL